MGRKVSEQKESKLRNRGRTGGTKEKWGFLSHLNWGGGWKNLTEATIIIIIIITIMFM